jgi:hypothetical protein
MIKNRKKGLDYLSIYHLESFFNSYLNNIVSDINEMSFDLKASRNEMKQSFWF